MAAKTGQLFELSGKELGKTYAQLALKSRAQASDARAFAYWAGGAGGRFTPLAAASCVSFIKACIDGKHPEVTSGFPLEQSRGSQRYNKLKEIWGSAGKHWFRSGTTRDAFTVRRESAGQYSMGVVTVDPTVDVPQISMTGDYTGTIAAANIVKWLEFGTTRQPARPLASKAIQRFVALNFPKMVAAVDKAITKWAKYANANYRNPEVSGAEVSDLRGAASTGLSPEAIVTRSVENDFADEQVKELRVHGGFAGSEGQGESARVEREQQKEAIKMARESGMSEEEIQNAIKQGWL